MSYVNDETAAAYRKAWDEWRKQVDHLHRVFLDGESIGPDQMKGLLNREARKKEAYGQAREKLLGLVASPFADASPEVNPFRTDE